MPKSQTIKQMLERRDTAELLEIWNKYDETEWRPEAFKAIASILEERGETLPEQKAKHRYLLHARRIEVARAEHERQQERRRSATMLAPWLGGVAAVFIIAGFALIVDAIYPEKNWPSIEHSPVLKGIAAGLAFGIFGLVWKWAASVVWRIMAGEDRRPRSKRETLR